MDKYIKLPLRPGNTRRMRQRIDVIVSPGRLEVWWKPGCGPKVTLGTPPDGPGMGTIEVEGGQGPQLTIGGHRSPSEIAADEKRISESIAKKPLLVITTAGDGEFRVERSLGGPRRRETLERCFAYHFASDNGVTRVEFDAAFGIGGETDYFVRNFEMEDEPVWNDMSGESVRAYLSRDLVGNRATRESYWWIIWLEYHRLGEGIKVCMGKTALIPHWSGIPDRLRREIRKWARRPVGEENDFLMSSVTWRAGLRVECVTVDIEWTSEEEQAPEFSLHDLQERALFLARYRTCWRDPRQYIDVCHFEEIRRFTRLLGSLEQLRRFQIN